MPTYEYRCKDCNHSFEAYQSFSEDALTECPECAGTVKKVFGNVGIAFKGSGFYKTDSRGGSKSGASATPSPASSSDGGSGSSSASGSKASSGSGSGSGSDSGSSGTSSTTSAPAPATT